MYLHPLCTHLPFRTRSENHSFFFPPFPNCRWYAHATLCPRTVRHRRIHMWNATSKMAIDCGTRRRRAWWGTRPNPTTSRRSSIRWVHANQTKMTNLHLANDLKLAKRLHRGLRTCLQSWFNHASESSILTSSALNVCNVRGRQRVYRFCWLNLRSHTLIRTSSRTNKRIWMFCLLISAICKKIYCWWLPNAKLRGRV